MAQSKRLYNDGLQSHVPSIHEEKEAARAIKRMFEDAQQPRTDLLDRAVERIMLN